MARETSLLCACDLAFKHAFCPAPRAHPLPLPVLPLPVLPLRVLAPSPRSPVHFGVCRKDPPPPPEDEAREHRTDDIIEWDSEFCKVDQGTLFELILAANYLDIKALLDLTCKTVANMIKGKTPEEIRKTFNIKNDFSPEEEEQVRKENEWVEDRM